jgi:transglutaminase-like putative cysteine protease
MRITVRHDSSYSYAMPARSAIQLLRMTPRSHESQFVRNWRVEVDADARLERDEDAYGNITHIVFIDGPVDGVRVTVQGEVDTIDTAGMLRGTVERLPLPLYLRPTALTAPTPALRALALRASQAEPSDPLAALHKLMAEIHRSMTFTVGATSVATTAGEALESGHGVCQDFAHVFIAAARALGAPARYVSGYYLRSDRADQDAGHAWAEAHVTGFGWVAFDAAHGVCTTDRHVRVAVGPDYLEAAPIRGARSGGAEEELTVAVRVQQGRSIAQS